MQTEEDKVRERYTRRNDLLKQLGYLSYRDYLASEDWKKIRREVLELGSACVMCERPAQVVHHVKYDMYVLLGLDYSRLAPLCHRCHEKIEVDGDTKRRMGTANVMLFAAARRTKHGRAWCEAYYKGCAATKKYRDAEFSTRRGRKKRR